MVYRHDIREEELKNRIAADFFSMFDHSRILGGIDFCIAAQNTEGEQKLLFSRDEVLYSLMWAEAKKSSVKDLDESFVQLILTIGKEKTNTKYLPPLFLGAFDAERIAFIHYHEVMGIFNLNDFNWNVAPSDHTTREFRQLYDLVSGKLSNKYVFCFGDEEKEIRDFIKRNFKPSNDVIAQMKVGKNNFTYVYQRWVEKVKPSIAANWETLKKAGLIDADFFLADLLSEKNKTIGEKLFVLLENEKYVLDKKIDELGLEQSKKVYFRDDRKAHKEFWRLYERPPKKEYWEYLVSRRDLLVPQDIRERKGSFFTPVIWVEKSQERIAEALGDNWQDEYVIWDCCAGTGNLLNGLANYRNVWASTLDKADVEVMKDRISRGWSMFENHVFQFDFLNDDFSMCPDDLKEILLDENKRKKLVVYINPPCAEHGNAKQQSGGGKNKAKVSTETKVYSDYLPSIGTAAREIFAQFLIRIDNELRGCIIAQFSKLKGLNAPNFAKFRTSFMPKLIGVPFIVPCSSFDNVKGSFPYGFFVWDSGTREPFKKVVVDVFDGKGQPLEKKTISSYSERKLVIEWLRKHYDKDNPNSIGFLRICGTDVQHNRYIFLTNHLSDNDIKERLFTPITVRNLIPCSIYYTIRQVVKQTWVNDRDQFLMPEDDSWEKDIFFGTDCLIYGLFSNDVSSEYDVNHWIPFTEQEVNCSKAFKSHFMSDFLKGKANVGGLFGTSSTDEVKLLFSPEATAVRIAGLNLWKYYHTKRDANPNASLFDIKKYFQGVDEKGHLLSETSDEHYGQLVSELRSSLKDLASAIKPKVYKYGFLL